MSVVPAKKIEKVQWFEDRMARWTSEATNIGTSTAAVTSLGAKVVAAREAYDAQQLAEAAYHAATEVFYNAVKGMGVDGQAIIKQVRAKAESTGDMDIYPLAMIPAPATPAPAAPPGTPRDFEVSLNSGDLHIVWKNTNPKGGGVVYQVYRRDTPTGDFVALGIAGEKKYIDSTVPWGASQITYKIRGVRPTAAGLWAELNVTFGVGGTGTITTTTGTPSPKLAA